jgi:hypothetical protein
MSKDQLSVGSEHSRQQLRNRAMDKPIDCDALYTAIDALQ